MLTFIDEAGLLKEDGVIVCEHGSEISLPEAVSRLQQVKHEKYGIIAVSIYSLQNGMED